MICPFCQQEVGDFTGGPGGRGLTCPSPDCPGKGVDVPLLYTRDYESHPPVPMSIIGPGGHGKTVYIEGLLTYLEESCRWPDFSCQWMDEYGMADIRHRLREVRETGRLPGTTQRVFPIPKILRLRNVPRVGGCQLLCFDTQGEVFRNSEDLVDAGRYVRNSPAVLWLISVTELEYPQQLSDLMTVYAQAMARMGADPKKQAIVVVLTKGDLLQGRPDFPAVARDFLRSDRLDPAGDAWDRLDRISAALQEWLRTINQQNVVNLLDGQFRAVKYCVVSAQGMAAAEGGESLRMQLMPRGVLAPLFWLWRLTRPAVRVICGGVSSTYFNLPAAVAGAPASATLQLGPGVYQAPAGLQLIRPLKMIGAGSGLTFIHSPAPDFTIGVRADGEVRLEGLTVAHVGQVPADVIRVTEGRLTLDRCRVSGGVSRPQKREANTLLAGDGLAVANAAIAVANQCRFDRNQGSGMSQSGTGTVALRRSAVTLNGGAGVRVRAGSVRIEGCDIFANGRSGALVGPNGALSGNRNRLHRNQKNGLEIVGAGAADSEHSRYSHNVGHGALVAGNGSLTCRGDECVENRESGLAAGGRARCEASGVLLQLNARAGVQVEGAADVVLVGNRCLLNRGAGISFAGRATGTCRDNTCSGNTGFGIRVQGEAAPELGPNDLAENKPADLHNDAAPSDGAPATRADPPTPKRLGLPRWLGGGG